MKFVLKFSVPGRRHSYRGGHKMRRALGRDFASLITWTPVQTKARGEMADVFDHALLSHGPARYLPIYESTLGRTKPIRMLAIGSFYEDSLKMWQDYLHPGSFLVSADFNSMLLKIAESGTSYVRMCHGQSDSFLRQVAAEFGPFDVILDQGIHTSSHMVEFFRRLFASALREGGIYIVEDVYCDYLKPYRDSRISFIDFVKALIDAMHAHYQVANYGTCSRIGDPDQIREVSVPAITPLLGGLEVYDSIVVVRRAAPDRVRSTEH